MGRMAVLLGVVLGLLLVPGATAFAQGPCEFDSVWAWPGTGSDTTGNGTKNNPFDTVEYARLLVDPNGGCVLEIIEEDEDEPLGYRVIVHAVQATQGPSGVPLPQELLYGLLAGAALLLTGLGLWLRRRQLVAQV